MVMCVVMIGPVVLDITGQALSGRPAPAVILGSYALLGGAIYLGFGRRASRVSGPVEPALAEPAELTETP
jgi:hypothetical protein